MLLTTDDMQKTLQIKKQGLGLGYFPTEDKANPLTRKFY